MANINLGPNLLYSRKYRFGQLHIVWIMVMYACRFHPIFQNLDR